MSTQSFDAVSLGIMWDRLVSLTDEIVSTLVRSSFSTIVYESYDLSCVVLDADTNSIAQGTFGIPAFIGSAPVTLRHMLKKFPAESLKPGDIVVTNDPWLGTGHLFDITMMRPVFRKGRIVAYTVSITHLPDIGGNGFGSASTEVYQEGLRLPICKLYEAGRLNELIVEIIRTNVRVPEQVMGDVMANVSCNEVGGRELLAFMDEYGLEDLRELSAAIRGQSERAMRAKISEFRDGTYRNRIQVEGFGEPVEFVVRVDVKGDSVEIDFDGTSGCVRAGVNVPICYTNAMGLHAIKSLTLPSIPNNEGSVAPIKVTAPPGCILNALPPFPTGGRHAMGHFVTPTIYGALAEAAPDRVHADSGMMNLITFQGRRRDDRAFSCLYFAAGGYGALENLDGWATLPHPSNMAVVPVEIWETLTNMTIESKRLLTDSGGPGKWRGGLGQEVVLRNDTGHTLTMLGMGNRMEFPARGQFGGGAGTLRVHAVDGKPVHAKGRIDVAPGSRITVTEAGGGGFGDPRQRDRASIASDLADGFISAHAARTIYGVEG
ncbi:MAG TPA: hydantoinase B/oxoprolinase family protein [Hyphomicrobiaceae bacterium]|nr:hydantoinase B/oxoprolinase family protein [Hyphomicrobiaceae bacterium]